MSSSEGCGTAAFKSVALEAVLVPVSPFTCLQARTTAASCTSAAPAQPGSTHSDSCCSQASHVSKSTDVPLPASPSPSAASTALRPRHMKQALPQPGGAGAAGSSCTERRLAAAENQVVALQVANGKLQTSLDAATSQLPAKDAAYAQLLGSFYRLQDRYASSAAQVQRLQAQLAAAEAELAVLRQQ